MSEPAVFKILSAQPELKRLLGDRIFSGSAPTDTKAPYLVWQGIGSTPENSMDCGATDENDSYQFAVWGHSTQIPQLNFLRDLARKALEANGLFYISKNPDGEDLETKLRSRGFDMNWWSNAADVPVEIVTQKQKVIVFRDLAGNIHGSTN